MNAYLKYGLLILLSVCLNLVISEAITISNEDVSFITNEYKFIPAQQQSNHTQAFDGNNIKGNLSCDVVDLLISKIPEAKYTIILNQKSYQEKTLLHKTNKYTPVFYFRSPSTYYVFGLKKIII